MACYWCRQVYSHAKVREVCGTVERLSPREKRSSNWSIPIRWACHRDVTGLGDLNSSSSNRSWRGVSSASIASSFVPKQHVASTQPMPVCIHACGDVHGHAMGCFSRRATCRKALFVQQVSPCLRPRLCTSSQTHTSVHRRRCTTPVGWSQPTHMSVSACQRMCLHTGALAGYTQRALLNPALMAQKAGNGDRPGCLNRDCQSPIVCVSSVWWLVAN